MAYVFHPEAYPASPGCYIMKGPEGRVLYIGKSINVRNRLRSYFAQRQTRRRMKQLVAEINEIEVVLVTNEAESLLLENNLIKRHKPPYNRALVRDNSGYAYLQLTLERFPRLLVSYRNRRRQTSSTEAQAPKRLGPFKSTSFRDAILTFVTEHYGLRTCAVLPKKVCLLYDIGKCSGVCEGKISEEEYTLRVRQAADLLARGGQGLLEVLYSRMEEYAEQLEFEKAQSLLQHIRVLEKAADKQVVDREIAVDQDVIYFGEKQVLIAKVQEGMLHDMQWLELKESLGPLTSTDQFLVTRYAEESPDELIVNTLQDLKKVRAALSNGKKKAPAITLPKRGLKYDLLQLCKHNYEYRLRREAAGTSNDPSL